jgi:hypothetical protein
MPLLAVCGRCEGRGWYWLKVRTEPDVIRVVEISCPVGCVVSPRYRRPGRATP